MEELKPIPKPLISIQRSKKETSIAIAKTVSYIKNRLPWSNADKMIERICLKNNVNEYHIRTLGGWKKNNIWKRCSKGEKYEIDKIANQTSKNQK